MQTACVERRQKRSYDNSTNGINFTIRKVNLMFVFIVVVWIFFFNKHMIQNPVFFVYSIVYAIVLSQAAQAHASRKKPTINSWTRHALCDERNRWKFEHVIRNGIGNEIWSIYNDKYLEIWTFFS